MKKLITLLTFIFLSTNAFAGQKIIVLNMVNEATKIILNNTSLLKCQRCSIIFYK